MAELYDIGIFSVEDTDGAVGAGWKLAFYTSGTSTPRNTYPTYADAIALTNPNTNPVIADAAGRFPPIYLIDGNYKAVLLTAANVVKATRDPAVFSLASVLALTGGAAMIGAATGGTVEDAIFHKGRVTPIAGSKMSIEWMRDDPASPLENQASIWSGKVETSHGFNKVFTSANGQAGSPSQTLFVRAQNNGSPGDIVAVTQIAIATANNMTCFGGNIIAASTGNSNAKLVGLEVDVEFSAGDSSPNSSSGGIYINIFNKAISGPALMTGGVSSGTFGNGIILGGLATTATGLALSSGGSANSLLNTTVGTYTGIALTLGNGQTRGIRLSGTAAAHAFIYNDGTNNVRHVLGSGGIAFRDNADANTLVSIDSVGTLNVTGAYQVDGVQVVSNRDTGWTAMTGSPDKSTAYATGTVTLPQLAGRVAFLQAVLTTHGLIGA